MNLWRHIAAGAGGGAVFLLFYLGLGDWPSVSLLAGIGAYAGFLLIGRALLPGPRPGAEPVGPELAAGAIERLRRLEAMAAAAGPALAPALRRVAVAAAPVVERAWRQPDQAMALRRLLTFHLDLALRLAEHGAAIVQLAGAGHPGLAKVAAMLDEVAAAFAAEADSAAANELMRLETELTVLERQLAAERHGPRPLGRE
ncbi:hypothetical protein [Zavarzinia sp.]|uniref:hypothetical protein n=1 Tax=Zavarzinia sp. TaxID=2027920 RepID=UPI003565073B